MATKNTKDTQSNSPTELNTPELNANGVVVLSSPLPVSNITKTQAMRRPERILLSQRYPGRKMFAVGLSEAGHDDEALAQMLVAFGRPLKEIADDVIGLRLLMINSKLTIEILSGMFQRPYASLSRGTYSVPEEMILSSAKTACDRYGANERVSFIYGQIIARCLYSLGIVSTGRPHYFSVMDKDLVLSIDELFNAYTIDRLKPVLSYSLITAKFRDVDLAKKNAAAVVQQRVADVMATAASSLLQVMAAVTEFDHAMYVIKQYYIQPETIDASVISGAELTALTSYANFLELLENKKWASGANDVSLKGYEAKHALQQVYSAISVLPSVQAASLDSFRSLFYLIPAISRRGGLVGAVVSLPMAQKADAQLVNAIEIEPNRWRVDRLPTSFAPAVSITEVINKMIMPSEVHLGLLNLIADSMVPAKTGTAGLALTTVNVSDRSLQMLAIARSRELALSNIQGQPFLIYGVAREVYVEADSDAALGNTLFFVSPVDAVVATARAELEPHTALPQRQQGIDRELATAMLLNWSASDTSPSIQKPFIAPVTLSTGETKLTFNMDIKITGVFPDISTPTSKMALIREPGVVREMNAHFLILIAMLKSDIDGVRYRALLSLARIFTEAAINGPVRSMADAAFVTSVLDSQQDARAIMPYVTETYFNATVYTFLASLIRLGYLDGDIGNLLIDQVRSQMKDVLLAMGPNLPRPAMNALATLAS